MDKFPGFYIDLFGDIFIFAIPLWIKNMAVECMNATAPDKCNINWKKYK